MKLLIHIIYLHFGLLVVGCSSNPQLAAENSSSKAMSVGEPTLSPEPKETDGAWRAAEFKSVRVGTDTRDKALKIFGKSIWSGDPPQEDPDAQDETDPEIWDQFEGADEMYSRITVMSTKKDGKILLIEAQVPNLPLDVVLRRFGNNYQRKEYGYILCVEGDPKSAILVEKPGSGDIFHYEYPDLGISVSADGKERVVTSVEYRYFPLVPPDRKCPPAKTIQN